MVKMKGEKNNDEVICRFDHESGELHNCIKKKAKHFVSKKCVRRKNRSGEWIVKHIPGYNTTDYTVMIIPRVMESCSCQFNTIKGLRCSHITAVRLYCKRNGRRL